MLNRLRLLTMSFAVIATMAATPALADDKGPPAKMEGGTAVGLIDPADQEPKPENVERVMLGNAPAIAVKGGDDETRRRIAEVKAPAVAGTRYMIKGWVRCEGVTGDGYLEMWSHFGDNAFFTRTLGDRGPMGKLSGNSGWRTFILPFNPEPGMTPDRLEVNVVLPGKGTVTVADLRLVDLGKAGAPTTAPAKSSPTPAPRSIEPPALTTGGAERVAILAASVGLLVAALAVLFALLLRMRQRRMVILGELRRMRAIDTSI